MEENKLKLENSTYFKDEILKLKFGPDLWTEFFEDPQNILSKSGDYVTLSTRFYQSLLKVSKGDPNKCVSFFKELNEALLNSSRYKIISHRDDPELERWLHMTDRILASGKLNNLEGISSEVRCPHDRTVGKYKFSVNDVEKLQTKLFGSYIYGRMISDLELYPGDMGRFHTVNKSLFQKSDLPGKKRFVEDIFYFAQEIFGLESEGLCRFIEIISKSKLIRILIGSGYDSQPLISKIKKEYQEMETLKDVAF